MRLLPKRIICFFFTLLLIIILQNKFIHPVLALNPNDIFHGDIMEFNQQSDETEKCAEGNQKQCVTGGETNDYALRSTMYNTICMIGCCNPNKCNPEKTALGNIGKFMATIYSYPPASGLAYTHDLLSQAGLVKSAYAQGIGFAAMTPFLPLWKTSRNIAYSIIIIIMVAIGFMIIFRMKIDPKTVISVQAALPRLVFTLLLITFSYPIVGFLIDIMYLSMAIIIALFVKGAGGTIHGHDIAWYQTKYMSASIWELFRAVFLGGFLSINDFWTYIGGATIGTGGAIGGMALFGLIGTGAAAVLATLPAVLIALAPILLFAFLLLLGLLFTFIRLALLLLNSYIQLIISIILSPLLLLTEAVPGKSAFSDWIKNILANLVVFPATAAVLLFVTYLTSSKAVTGNYWQPPFTGVPGNDAIEGFLGLGVIFLAPNLIASVKKAFQPKPVLPISAATAFAPITGAAQTGMGAASQWYYIQQLMGHGDQQTGLGKMLSGLTGKKREQE